MTGMNMFAFVSVGFAVKSLAKNLIGSPRVFWLFPGHNAIYCGTGMRLRRCEGRARKCSSE